MKRLLQEPVLNTDIDFDTNDLLNVNEMLPVPTNLVDFGDVRLDNQRPVPAGSITNDKVSPVAAIDQSKLNLNGNLPAAWLGTTDTTAAQGSLVQPKASKNTPSGYAGLDANGKVAFAQLPSTGPNSGTVSEVKLSMPQYFNLGTSRIINSGSLSATWQNVPDNTWFGVSGQVGFGPAGVPSFIANLIPDSIMPSIDSAKFTTGLFALERLPVVKPLGVGHAAGIVPDPGDVGDPTDYLARDASYKRVTNKVNYQPDLPNVQITLQYYQGAFASILLYCPNKKARIFYHIQNILLIPILTPYVEAKTNPIVLSVNPQYTVYAYAARAGYNPSPVNNYTVPQPP